MLQETRASVADWSAPACLSGGEVGPNFSPADDRSINSTKRVRPLGASKQCLSLRSPVVAPILRGLEWDSSV